MNRTLRVSLRSQVREKIGVAGTFVICFSAGGGEELLLATCHSWDHDEFHVKYFVYGFQLDRWKLGRIMWTLYCKGDLNVWTLCRVHLTDNTIEAGEAILSSENNYVTYFQLKNS